MDLIKAYIIANETIKILSPHCHKIDIAGSIRREKSQVKDIEICCLPKFTVETDMFGNVTGKCRDVHFRQIVYNLGDWTKGSALGKYVQRRLKEDIILDLFIPDPWDYYRQYAIRTGSADYSHKILAAGWRKKGWCGSDKGLRKISDCKEDKSSGKSVWKCINKNAELPPVWTSEEDFFDWLGIKWIEPKMRNVQDDNN